MASETEILDEKQFDVLIDELLEAYPPASTDPVTFLGAQFDRGHQWRGFGLASVRGCVANSG